MPAEAKLAEAEAQRDEAEAKLAKRAEDAEREGLVDVAAGLRAQVEALSASKRALEDRNERLSADHAIMKSMLEAAKAETDGLRRELDEFEAAAKAPAARPRRRSSGGSSARRAGGSQTS